MSGPFSTLLQSYTLPPPPQSKVMDTNMESCMKLNAAWPGTVTTMPLHMVLTVKNAGLLDTPNPTVKVQVVVSTGTSKSYDGSVFCVVWMVTYWPA